jgi:Protein of unknown function (DUF1501)
LRACSQFALPLKSRNLVSVLCPSLRMLVRPNGSIPYFTSAGRDHWTDCFFALFAGAGVRGGQVIGRSDAMGEHPVTHPYRHSDVAATVYSALGIEPSSEFVDIQGDRIVATRAASSSRCKRATTSRRTLSACPFSLRRASARFEQRVGCLLLTAS